MTLEDLGPGSDLAEFHTPTRRTAPHEPRDDQFTFDGGDVGGMFDEAGASSVGIFGRVRRDVGHGPKLDEEFDPR